MILIPVATLSVAISWN